MHLFDLFEDNATEGKILHPNRINLYLNLRKPNAKPIVVGHNIPYKAMDAVIQKIVDKYSNIEADMFEFRPVGSLREDSGENDLFAAYDKILIDLCAGIIKHQKQDSDRYGLVAAAVVDPDHNVVYGINHKLASGKRVHAERAAMANYIKRHGVIPKNSIIITTLSPCTDDMPDRKGPSCTELLNGSPITRVYAGYRDPSQTHLSHDEFDVVYTQNSKIESICKQIADCFLKESAYTDPANYRSEGVAEGSYDDDDTSMSEKLHDLLQQGMDYKQAVNLVAKTYNTYPEYVVGTYNRWGNHNHDPYDDFGEQGVAEGATKIHSDKEPKLTGFSFQQLDSLCESAGSDYVKFDRAIKKNLVLPAWTNTLELYGVYARKLNEVKSKTLAEGTQSDIEQQLFDRLTQRALGSMDSASVGDRVSLLHLATLNIPGHKVVAKLNGFLTPKQIVKIVNTGRFQQLEFADGSRYPEKDGGDIFQQAQTWNMTKLFPSADAASKAFMFYMLEGQKLSDVLDFQPNVDQGVAENFADGKNPGRKGLAKRSGVNTKASVSSLRKTAKHSTGEKARMAHWLANMKAGKKKHAKEAVDEDAINEIENLQSYQYTGGKDVLKHPRYTDPDAVSRKNIKPLPGGSGLNYATIDHGRFLEIRMLDQSGQEAVGQLKLMRVGFPINNAYQVSTVTVDEDYRGKGIAKSLYGVALSILKITLLAGSQQTPGGKRNWMSLAQIPGVEVRGYVELENSDLKYKKLHKQKNAKDLANAERRNAIVDKNIDIVMGRLGGDYLGDDKDGNMIFAFDVVPGTGSLTPAVKTELNKLYYGEYDMLYVTGLYAQWRGA